MQQRSMMPEKYITQPGDCISSIAYAYGFFPETVWQHEKNAALRALRESPNLLIPGDAVWIPDKRIKSAEIPTGQRHRFRRRGVPERLELRFLDSEGQPRTGLAYEFQVDGAMSTGTTDGSGWLREKIRPDALSAHLRLETGEEYEIEIGKLWPGNTIRGLQQRLQNLGYSCASDQPDRLESGTVSALERFYADQNLPSPPRWDAAALARASDHLRAAHAG
jgi:hypothetical protein